MSITELQKRLIHKIQNTKDDRILEEAYRLLEIESDNSEPYPLTEEQKSVVQKAKIQINNGQFLTDEQANNEIDEWLFQTDHTNS